MWMGIWKGVDKDWKGGYGEDTGLWSADVHV